MENTHYLTHLELPNIPSLHDEWLYYLTPRFLSYRPKQIIFFKTEKYTLKTADSLSELIELFRLRHHIFLSENKNENLLDVDSYDSECDHILIKCNTTNKICGTYRVITANNQVGFYSESEFDLGNFLKVKSVKMELGRACIHPYHRNGHVIDLLWKGIGEYAVKINAQHIFGCSSMPIISENSILGLVQYLKKNDSYSEVYDVKAIGKFYYDLSSVKFCDYLSDPEIIKLIPPLLSSYINAGAKVFGMPAIDQDFDCLDFLTILDVSSIKSSYRKRYFKNDF